jgi:hypothetical protein
MTTVKLDGTNLLVRTELNDVELIKCRNIPQRRFIKTKKAWQCRASLTNMEYIKAAWPNAEWDDPAKIAWYDAFALKVEREKVRDGKNEIDLSTLRTSWIKAPARPKSPSTTRLTTIVRIASTPCW